MGHSRLEGATFCQHAYEPPTVGHRRIEAILHALLIGEPDTFLEATYRAPVLPQQVVTLSKAEEQFALDAAVATLLGELQPQFTPFDRAPLLTRQEMVVAA